jgi:hypothetical protein
MKNTMFMVLFPLFIMHSFVPWKQPVSIARLSVRDNSIENEIDKYLIFNFQKK